MFTTKKSVHCMFLAEIEIEFYRGQGTHTYKKQCNSDFAT